MKRLVVVGGGISGLAAAQAASVDADRVETEVAGVLRVAPDRLESTPIDRDALLVVDNCEHVQEAAASIVERLLRRVPSLRVLATSRAPLLAASASCSSPASKFAAWSSVLRR